MGFLSSGQKTQITKYSGLQIESTSSCLPIPMAYGCNILAPNVIWYDHFQAKPAGGKTGGKGGNGVQSWTYSCALIMGLCEGPIMGVGNVWDSSPTPIPLSKTGLSLYDGTANQPVWSWLATNYPAQALTYQRTAYLCASNYNLGSSASVNTNNFEVHGTLYQTGFNSLDADPALVIQDFLTNGQYGVGFPAASIAMTSLLGGSNTGAYQAYCRAVGLAISPVLNTQEKASSILSRWLQLTNSTAVWSGGQLKIMPYGDASITGAGQTWLASDTPLYDLSDEDFVGDGGADPIQITRSDPFSAYNQQPIEIQARNDDYNTGPVVAFDQAAIDRFGLRIGSSITAHEICDLTIAQTAAQLILQRGLYIRNTYHFKLSWEFCLLEPMDLVTLSDPLLGLNKTVVRIIDIEEDADGLLTVTAEEFPQGVASATQYPTQGKSNGAPNAQAAPGSINAPIIFEPPGELARALQVWIVATGQNPALWGGCHVWASYDGVSYAQVGEILSGARQGVLLASLPAIAATPAGPTIDQTNTLRVNLSESAGSLLSGTQSDAQNGATLCYVDGELIAYETAALTGTNTYNLTYLVRGLYGTQGAVAAHSSGAPFARLDNAVFRYTYTNVQIGAPVWLKFTSFNIWGGAEESLADVTAYTHTLSGAPTPNAIVILSDSLTQQGLSLTLAATWQADPLAVAYIADISADDGATWTNVYNSAGAALSVPGLNHSSLALRLCGVSSNDVKGPYTIVTVTGPALNYSPAVNGYTISYDDLASSLATAVSLDPITQADDATVAAMGGALTQGQNAALTQAQTAAAQAAVNVQTTMLAGLSGAFASYQTNVSAQFGTLNANLASVTQTLTTLSTAQTAQAQALTSVTAQSAAGTASGVFNVSASSGVGTGVSAAVTMGVSAAGAGGTPVSSGLTLQVVNGVGQVIVSAANFYILNNGAATVPFAVVNGSVALNGVTYVNGAMQSQATTASGAPVFQLNWVTGQMDWNA